MMNNDRIAKDNDLYVSSSGYLNSRNRNRSKFENREVFRSGLSRYDIKTSIITPGGYCKWDKNNCSGVPLDYDSDRGQVFLDGSDAHTILIGATGSKKSRLVVMPTVRALASANENMVICDPKGEIYRRTASYLNQKGYEVYAINLREPDKGDGWNMLSVPYNLFLAGEIDKACEMINDAAVTLMPVNSKDPYWDFSARDMFFGLVLLLFEISKQNSQDTNIVNMQSVLKLREELFESMESFEIQKTSLWKFAKKHDLIRTRLNGIVVCPEKTMACIISVFDQHMSCFSLQPLLINMLSQSTFDLNELGFGKVAIFMLMPDEKSTYHRIITVFIKQIYELLIDNAFKLTNNNRYSVRINFILDEFSSLPTISDFPQMISASRSRNIRFILVVQSKHQLKQRYDEETETIMSNCSNWIFLTSREIGLLREISELSGVTGSNHENLISISWLQHMDKDKGECLVFSGRKHPYITFIPDIDEYDNNQYAVIEMKPRNQSQACDNYFKTNYFSSLVNQDEPIPQFNADILNGIKNPE